MNEHKHFYFYCKSIATLLRYLVMKNKKTKVIVIHTRISSQALPHKDKEVH